MVPSSDLVNVGSRLSIHVQISGAWDLGSVPFHVRYNPAVLRFEAGREGVFLGGDGKPTAFFTAPMSSGDEMVVGLSRLGEGTGIEGGGELCVLDFTVVGAGDAGLAFARAQLRDSDARLVPGRFEPAVVTAR
jgi:hypothetical protein